MGGTTDSYDYSYDVAGRLKDVTKNGTISAVYGYDSNGNRIAYTTPVLGTIGGVYDAQDRLADYGQLHFTYTANGELLTKSNPNLGQTATYSYDVLGNLKSVILPGRGQEKGTFYFSIGRMGLIGSLPGIPHTGRR